MKFTRITGVIAPMLAPNIDTDVIMPKQFLKGIDRQGLDRGLFFDLRFLANGESNPDFILNKTPWQHATFLLVGNNFGCGSSREHAVWGLQQIGIRALVGTSFAGIFNDNCQRNGILTITLSEDEVAYLASIAESEINNEISIDLVNQQIMTEAKQIPFNVDETKKHALVNWLDAVGFTLQYEGQIKAFEQQYYRYNPWLDVNKLV